MSEPDTSASVGEIAIIGMTGRFPRARHLEEFWHNLAGGVEAISFYTDEELLAAGVEASRLADPSYVKAGAPLPEVEMFDAAFFGFTPREAETIDPQQRQFLECAWEALEAAGYDADTYAGQIGVYAGAGNSLYALNIYADPRLAATLGEYQIEIGNNKDHLCTRVSYKLNLRGPSISVQTGCSTSLVAVHLACQGLLDYECDMALAGGVSLSTFHKEGYAYSEGGVRSPDGHCRAFDARAQGTVGGSGVGIVALKRLSDALRDGDHIHAVIKGSAINNDGSAKIGYTAPSVTGQAEVIAKAQALAGVEPESIAYVEAHGTGTPLGDPVEIAALTKAFRAGTSRTQFCALGSLKTNIGHLNAAAGVAGLIKTVLALEHRQLPPSLHFEQPNPQIDFDRTPFYVNRSLSSWPHTNTPLRAGVSAFSIGGTNAHVILEEAPPRQTDTETDGEAAPQSASSARAWQLLTLSARTATALETATSNLLRHFREHPETRLADAAYTLHVGRRAFAFRRTILCRDTDEAVAALSSLDASRVATAAASDATRRIVFMFAGQGAQRANMTRELYESEPVFRAELERCATLLRPSLGIDLRDALFHNEATAAQGETRAAAANAQLAQTLVAQPALFAVEYALAKLWEAWGVRPALMIGHSLGEYVAACLAGVMSLEDALSIVAARGRLMQRLPEGAMLAVSLSERETQKLLGEKLSLAAVNSASHCVVSGEREAVAELEASLAARGVASRRLHTSHAFHSATMDAIVEEFTAQVRKVRLQQPQTPFISNLTGARITADEATDPAYWGRHLRQTVRFADGLAGLLKEPEPSLLVEVSPGQTLSTLARESLSESRDARHLVLASLGAAKETRGEVAAMLRALGQLWLNGVKVDWTSFHAHEQTRRTSLPTYPFERERFWIDGRAGAASRAEATAASGVVASVTAASAANSVSADAALDRQPELANWFYAPLWKQAGALSSLPQRADAKDAEGAQKSLWLVLVETDDEGLGARLVARLRAERQSVISLRAAARFARIDEQSYTVNPHRREDFEHLFEELEVVGKYPDRIVHLWGATPAAAIPADAEAAGAENVVVDAPATALAANLDDGFDGFNNLLFLAQALGNRDARRALRLDVVSSNLHGVLGEDALCPQKALAVGLCRIIPKEYPHIACRSIDVHLPASASSQHLPHGASTTRALVEQLRAELDAHASEQVVALRGRHRWVQSFEPLRLEAVARPHPRLREGGVYLLTGATDPNVHALAEHLAHAYHARLVLIDGANLPPRAEWEAWLGAHDGEDETSRRLQRLRAAESWPGEALFFNCDVAALEEMRAAVGEACERFGKIDGVVHAEARAGGGLMQLKTPEMAASVLSPKVGGTLVLETVLAEQSLDFVVLFSSVTSMLAGFGQSDECAANAFLDAYAHGEGFRNSRLTTTINWGLWRQVEEASAQGEGLTLLENSHREMREAFGLSARDSVEAFERILSTSARQLIVSPQDFRAVLAHKSALTTSRFMADLEAQRRSEPAHARPQLGNDYVPPGNPVEEVIADIWQEIFGIERIGVQDDFLELGGHSLLAVQLVNRIREALQIELPLQSFFESPTIGGLAEKISEQQLAPAEMAEIEELFNEIKSLSTQEAQAQLADALRLSSMGTEHGTGAEHGTDF